MKNLVYYMFSPGIYSDEITFSLLSAFRYLEPSRSDYRFIIYSPPGVEFPNLRAEVIRYDPRQLAEWSGPRNFQWRIKLKTMEDVLRRFNEPAVLIDGDTYFQKSPDRLFDRIRPGHSLLHICEGRVCDLEDEIHHDLTRLLTEKNITDPFTGVRIASTTMMWNSGVMGLHPADTHIVEKSLALTDQIVAEDPIYTSEQFASSYLLEKYTRLHAGDDVVYHFWSKMYRRPFRPKLTELVRRTEGMPEGDRAAVLYASRPRTPLRRRMRNRMVHAMDGFGVRFHPECPRQNG